MEGLKKLPTTRKNNNTNEDKDASYDFLRYFLLCYWVISSNFWRTCWFSCSDCRSFKTLCTLTSTVQLPFTCTFSRTQTKLDYGGNSFGNSGKFPLSNSPQKKSKSDSVSGHYYEKVLGENKASILVSIHRTTKFTIFCFDIWTTSQKHTHWMLHLVATWASSSLSRYLWILSFQTGSFSTWNAAKLSPKYRAINRDVVAMKAFSKK